jgi:protein SCO1/2
VILAVGVALTACGGRNEPRPGDLRGASYPDPLPKPEFTLNATDGRPFDFRRATEGYVTLLYFGYTHCPDICPVHLANIAAVLTKLTPQVTDRIKVVFVTVDPERDTPARLRAWLDNFNRDFVGLVGPLDSVNAIQQRLLLPASIKVPGADDEGYLMGHSARVIAFTRDDSAHVGYPFGTRQEDWAHDLPILVRAWTGGT